MSLSESPPAPLPGGVESHGDDEDDDDDNLVIHSTKLPASPVVGLDDVLILILDKTAQLSLWPSQRRRRQHNHFDDEDDDEDVSCSLSGHFVQTRPHSTFIVLSDRPT